MNQGARIGADRALLFFWKVLDIERFAVLDNDMCFFQLREMIFKNLRGIIQAYWNNRTAGFLSNLKTALMKFHEGVGRVISCPLRENADGCAGFHQIDACKDRFKPSFRLSRSRNWHFKKIIQTFNSGTRLIPFLAT